MRLMARGPEEGPLASGVRAEEDACARVGDTGFALAIPDYSIAIYMRCAEIQVFLFIDDER
jgi:hypothetical protein